MGQYLDLGTAQTSKLRKHRPVCGIQSAVQAEYNLKHHYAILLLSFGIPPVDRDAFLSPIG